MVINRISETSSASGRQGDIDERMRSWAKLRKQTSHNTVQTLMELNVIEPERKVREDDDEPVRTYAKYSILNSYVQYVVIRKDGFVYDK